MPEDWGINVDAFRSPSDAMLAACAKFAEVQKHLSEFLAEHQRNLPHLLNLMIQHSWYPDFYIPAADSRTLEGFAINGDFRAIENYLIDYFRNAAVDVERRLCEKYPHRACVLGEAFSSYRCGRYVLAIPVFLAQADGISEQILNKHFFTFKKSGRAAEKLINDGLVNGYARVLLEPLVRSGTIRDHTDTLTGKTGYLNRHAILHGSDLDYGSETNALKSISLLAYLLLVSAIKV